MPGAVATHVGDLAQDGGGTDRAQAHIGQATVLVCADCRLDEARRRVVSAHELGHAIGLPHVAREGSIMHPLGGPQAPDPLDVETARDGIDTAELGLTTARIKAADARQAAAGTTAITLAAQSALRDNQLALADVGLKQATLNKAIRDAINTPEGKRFIDFNSQLGIL